MTDSAPTAGTRARKVAFSAGACFVGCLVAGFAFMVLTFAVLSTEKPGTGLTGAADLPAIRLTILMGGVAGLGFLLLGPTVGYAIGWLLRRVGDQSVHVIAFAVAGAVAGAVVGLARHDPAMANLLGPMVGASAAVGRMAVSPFARV